MTGLDASAAAHLAGAAAAGLPPLDQLSPAAARDRFDRGFAADQAPHEPVTDMVTCRAGHIRLKVWRGMSTPATGAPALLYLHGGGWLLGSPESHEAICRQIANRAGAVVVAPDYRHAPDHPFPAGLTDCAEALRYLYDKANDLGVDPDRIAVGGDSAGGNLAAVLAVMSRDEDLPPLAAQLLIYPNTSQEQSTDSFKRFARGFGLTATEMAWFRGHYLPDRKDWTDWRAAPLLAQSLAGTAPAVVVLAGHDILLDEGVAYAARLGTESRARCRTWPGQIHGFLSLDRAIPEAGEAITWLCAQWAEITA